MAEESFKARLKHSLPPSVRRWWHFRRLGVGHRLDPVRRSFGLGAGRCIDRYYIETFLECHAGDIANEVLEFQDNRYTVRFGGTRVTRSDVLDLSASNAQATLVGDLAKGEHLPSERFDCIIATQVLQYPYDVRAAVRTLFRMLKPGGILLGSVPGMSQISPYDRKIWGENWRFTSTAVRTLFSESFGPENVNVHAHGNLLVATAFLHGLVVEELDPRAFDVEDREYELTLTVRAVRR